jgi:hypothetical protein
MAARKKAGKEASSEAEAVAAVPKPTAAGREKDKEEQPHVFRVDLGEALPTPPIRTATDKK